jgi:type II secretory pathway component GspD/PulD (secretin)
LKNGALFSAKSLFLSILFVSTVCPAQVATDPDTAYSPIVTGHLNPRLKAPITLWAKDANLSEVLKVLSEKSGMNFVAGEGVDKSKITIILNKTPLDEAINLLVRASGLSYEIIGNSVLIAEPDMLKEEVGMSGYVVECRYVEAREVANILSDVTKNVKVDQGGNRLICYTSPRVILEIEKIVRSIDHPHILVVLETRLIEVKLDNLGKYGIDWGSLMPIQTGLSYEKKPLAQSFKLDNWTQLPVNLNVTLDMLISNGDARVLMNSKLTTTNNREASLHIGEIVPYEIQSYNLTQTGGMNREIQKEEIGIKVTMTPHINEKNQITLALEPEVSSIAGWKGAASDIPLIRVRKTKTTVRVEDGQTLFLAGLLAEEKTNEVRKVPVLGDIPLIGLLFQHVNQTTTKSNLIIEVTPKIIYNPNDLNYGTSLKSIEDKALDMKPEGEKEK